MEVKKANIIVLYNELSEYFLVCLSALCNLSGWNAIVISYPLKDEAPFEFNVTGSVKLMNRHDFTRKSIEEIIIKNDPKFIFVGGWFDGDYLKSLSKSKSTCVKLLGFDNAWNGSLKQSLSAFYARFFIRPLFNIAFVPGSSQKLMAENLGFRDEEIVLGAYSADTAKFQNIFETTQEQKKFDFPKRFLYLGRYTQHKGIFDLWEAFLKFRETNHEWELWCVGTGDQFDNRVEAEGIKHFGFVQPNDMLPILKETGVYILPSHFEPWGVSVHEMAVAGLPMLLSDKIGSKEDFLDGNGMEFKTGNVDQLLNAMHWIAGLDKAELLDMSKRSHHLGMKNSPKIWAEKLLSII